MLPINTRMATSDRVSEPPSAARSLVRKSLLLVSAALTLVGAFWIARSFRVDGKLRFGNPVELTGANPNMLDPQPRQVRAEVTRVRGNAVVREGDRCEFLIERPLSSRDAFHCHAQVVCGGRLLFGGPDRGYFVCKLYEDERRDVVGDDPNTTGSDKDAAFHINTRNGVMRIWDDDQGPLGAFDVEAEILSVQ
jgi:hypothetical protein